jgi:zinc transport system permease protein
LPDQFVVLVTVAACVMAIHVWWMRGFMLASLDPDGARTRGIPVRLLNMMLLVTIAVSIALATRILGALPVFAFTVLPALAALRLVHTVQTGVFIAGALGATSGFVGYLMAFRFALPVGASQALVAASLVFAAELLYRIRFR